MYHVSNDIPIPPPQYGRNSKYRFPNLEVGESFVVSTEKECLAVRQKYHRKGMRLAIRKNNGVDTNNGYRVWRLA